MLKNLVCRLKKDEEGATMVEYTILLGMVALGVITVVTFLSGWMTTTWQALEAGIRAMTP
jgi:pilus assembly protein Flp/PilA